jgi:hypothetical protein
MKIDSIEIKDTNGILSKDMWKTVPGIPSVQAYFDKSDKNKQVVKILPGNVNFITTGGDIDTPLSYKMYLMYNGTLDTKDRLFKRIVAEGAGKLDRQDIPTLEYSPNGMEKLSLEELDDSIYELSIKMHTGVADVLEYKEGALVKGEKMYNVKAVHNYPMMITEDPIVENNVVFLDGWYTYTFVMFRDVVAGDVVVKDLFYAYKGLIFKASVSGVIKTIADDIFIFGRNADGVFENIIQTENSDYMEMRVQLESRDGVGSNYNHSYIETQLLITDELRDAIVSEIVCSIDNNDTGCMFADWQVLTLKRQAAAIMFWNELYRNAQTIIESSRKMCHPKYKEEC